jgi:hypothetical protein
MNHTCELHRSKPKRYPTSLEWARIVAGVSGFCFALYGFLSVIEKILSGH